jgi:SagB-type dehydrogenase family enzyme
MRLRTARTLLATPSENGVLIYNFLEKVAAECSHEALYWMSYLQQWTAEADILKNHPHLSAQAVSNELQTLTELSVLIIENSAQARKEQNYNSSWEWGLAAGALHFSTANMQFMSLDESVQQQIDDARHKSRRVPQFIRNNSNAIPIEGSSSTTAEALISLMERRRTNRSVKCPSISLSQLSDCLYAGMGITGGVRTPTGTLPLSMTPSGGARNPYEAYVYARAVNGLDPGFYHYSAFDRSLDLVGSTLLNIPSEMLAGQSWAEPMPVIIFLVAYLERAMWKYKDANAYRVVLIEAGHIGQNIMLAATAHGLSACPTAALHHDLIARHLKLDEITHTPIYALTLSEPAGADSEVLTLTELAQLTELSANLHT